MLITSEQLAEIELFASRGFTVNEIAVVLNINIVELSLDFNQPDSVAYPSFERGRLKALLDIRNSIFASAVSGSSPAQTEILKIFNSQFANLKLTKPDA
jgi:hypothetical protein